MFYLILPVRYNVPVIFDSSKKIGSTIIYENNFTHDMTQFIFYKFHFYKNNSKKNIV